jgi:two-component sensor histidine kinase
MGLAETGEAPARTCEGRACFDVRVRRVSLLWWAATFFFSCLLNFIAEPPRDWPGDLVNYAAGSAAGAAWSPVLTWALERRRLSGRAEAFWMGLGLAAFGGCLSGLVAGLASQPVIVGLRLGQSIPYQFASDLEHYTALFVTWYFLYLAPISVDRAIGIEENVARLRVLVFKAEDAALREQVQPETLREYFSRLSAVLDEHLQKEAEDLVLNLSERLRATLRSQVSRAPQQERYASVGAEGVGGLELGVGPDAVVSPGSRIVTRFHVVNLVFWLAVSLLLFVTLAPAYVYSINSVKLRAVWDWVSFCALGCFLGAAFTCFWNAFSLRGGWVKKTMMLLIIYLLAAVASACVFGLAEAVCLDHGVLSVNIISAVACYYLCFYVAWNCVYNYARAVRREVTQRALLAQAAGAAAAARNRMLRYQVRPHFLFNALNALYALVADRRWAAARAMTQALSQYFERSFAEDERAFVPISEQVEILQTYLSIERVRFGERLRVRVDIAEGLACAYAPSLILQPLIENAMKYAVAATADPVDVEIAAEMAGDSGDTLLLRVRDSGGDPAAPAAPGLGIGLRNVAARLAGHYGERGLLECRRLTPNGFVAEIRLPLEFA